MELKKDYLKNIEESLQTLERDDYNVLKAVQILVRRFRMNRYKAADICCELYYSIKKEIGNHIVGYTRILHEYLLKHLGIQITIPKELKEAYQEVINFRNSEEDKPIPKNILDKFNVDIVYPIDDSYNKFNLKTIIKDIEEPIAIESEIRHYIISELIEAPIKLENKPKGLITCNYLLKK